MRASEYLKMVQLGSELEDAVGFRGILETAAIRKIIKEYCGGVLLRIISADTDELGATAKLYFVQKDQTLFIYQEDPKPYKCCLIETRRIKHASS